MLEIGSLTYKPNSFLKKENLALLVEFSHLCLALPLKLTALADNYEKGLFLLEQPSERFPLTEWDNLLTFSSLYKVQFQQTEGEKESFVSVVELIDKKFLDNALLLCLKVKNTLDENFSPIISVT